MGMNLAKQTFSTEPDYLIAGANVAIETTAKTAAGAISKGAPVKLDSNGKAAAVSAKADTLYGIAAEDAAADEPIVIYLSGEFFADKLALPDGVTAADLEVGFRNIGIFLK
ncbi:MAG: DUF2190 family protein [Clostridium sp.]|nr:DUF2190 family protein [Clostridium sp.]